ncbi:chondroitin sulfate N-acetylgalactosaminyltransferase 2-like [Anopheles darlingi]|uniref:chondroitin sulfate N-acetylgalactosaminyltransferase 2-like n=1 Tax=Anopheles darlingi TaxID=43151 RepID=UPI0020FFF757|nr:chondroitin sulfate N-acetylgalactosaminyltransferase 2-like [Anopheles darlingi]
MGGAQHHDSHHGTTKLIVMRPFAPLQTIHLDAFPRQQEKELIYIVLPLSGRISTFQSFMDKYVKIALKHDKYVHLTVVYFGDYGLSEARTIMSRVIGMKNSGGTASNLKLLALNETFSRAKALRVGAENVWSGQADKNKDILLFMCDVDIVFSAKFLDRCRWNTKPNKMVTITQKLKALEHCKSQLNAVLGWKLLLVLLHLLLNISFCTYDVVQKLMYEGELNDVARSALIATLDSVTLFVLCYYFDLLHGKKTP